MDDPVEGPVEGPGASGMIDLALFTAEKGLARKCQWKMVGSEEEE